jgi:hypothetical protein
MKFIEITKNDGIIFSQTYYNINEIKKIKRGGGCGIVMEFYDGEVYFFSDDNAPTLHYFLVEDKNCHQILDDSNMLSLKAK